MSLIIGVKADNMAVAEAFSTLEFWQPEYRSLFAPGCVLEFPVAPPGWLQKLRPGEDVTHFDWLCRTVKNWKWKNVAVYATNFPDKFWIMRDGEGDVFWAGKEGRYDGRFVTRLTIESGKITYIKDYFDSIAAYKAAGIELPLFKYDAPDPMSMPIRDLVPDVTGDPEALAAQTKATLSKFVSVDFWEGEINANDIVHELPFTPVNMPKRYNAREYDALNDWIGRNCLEWETYPGSILYETHVPGVYFIESGGVGYMSWTGVEGVYQQRELSFLRIENGYAKEFHEYFNPLNKFNSINTPIPTFPYLY